MTKQIRAYRPGDVRHSGHTHLECPECGETLCDQEHHEICECRDTISHDAHDVFYCATDRATFPRAPGLWERRS